jgi:hypothetical protein
VHITVWDQTYLPSSFSGTTKILPAGIVRPSARQVSLLLGSAVPRYTSVRVAEAKWLANGSR